MFDNKVYRKYYKTGSDRSQILRNWIKLKSKIGSIFEENAILFVIFTVCLLMSHYSLSNVLVLHLVSPYLVSNWMFPERAAKAQRDLFFVLIGGSGQCWSCWLGVNFWPNYWSNVKWKFISFVDCQWMKKREQQ